MPTLYWAPIQCDQKTMKIYHISHFLKVCSIKLCAWAKAEVQFMNKQTNYILITPRAFTFWIFDLLWLFMDTSYGPSALEAWRLWQ